MPGWDAEQYLLFERERSQPCRDLVHRVELESPGTVVDLGCGTGTSTAVLKRRWPMARLTGVDSSADMLRVARKADPSVEWIETDLNRWTPDANYDLVFSNAAFHWIPDHSQFLSRWWRHVAPRGVFAFQVPAPGDQRTRWVGALREVLGRASWRGVVAGDPTKENVLSLSEYYDILREGSQRMDLWDTEYCHVLPTAQSVVEWTKGTALRPVLERLTSEEDRTRFLAEYTTEIERVYPCERDGRVLFPFLRRFVVAYRR